MVEQFEINFNLKLELLQIKTVKMLYLLAKPDFMQRRISYYFKKSTT